MCPFPRPSHTAFNDILYSSLQTVPSLSSLSPTSWLWEPHAVISRTVLSFNFLVYFRVCLLEGRSFLFLGAGLESDEGMYDSMSSGHSSGHGDNPRAGRVSQRHI